MIFGRMEAMPLGKNTNHLNASVQQENPAPASGRPHSV
jgi:hypothetical protein